MSAVNNINLFGRISQLDFTIVNENLAIIEFTLAVHDYHDQENDVDHVQWIRCKLYGKPKIENIANNMEKGQQIAVSGKLKIDNPEDREGYYPYVKVDDLRFGMKAKKKS